MAFPKVAGTQVRGSTYHFNLPIPKAIQASYPAFPAGIMRGTLRTSDPKEAEKQVREQRVIFDRKVKEAHRLADRDRILGTLGQEDRDLLAEIGGPERLLDTIRSYRMQAAFTLAGAGAETALTRATTDTPEHVLRVAEAVEARESEAVIATLTGETRRLKRVADAIGEKVPAPPKGIDESGDGIHALAEAFTKAKGWTVQNREDLMRTVRRWVELHGDMPVTKWERRHLDQFDEVLTGFPLTNDHELRKLTIRKAVERAERDKLPLISPKVRTRYSDHMKSLSKYALNQAGLTQADPFAGFQARKPKEKFSTQNEQKTLPFTPEQVGKIIDQSRSTYDSDLIDHWLPLLAAYLGARREELGQMLVSNVRLVGNIHVIEITDDDPAQKVKNKHSMRVVPLPTPIIEAGFLDLVDRRRKAGGHFLFLEDVKDKQKRVHRGEVEPDKRGRLTERYGHRFARKVRDPLKLKQPGLVFHSLRHSWTDAARRAKIDKETRRLIAGRLDGEDPTEAGYGGDDLLAEKLEALERVAKYVRD
ncbi:site-specific integrase [Tabrizicola sp.]|uniref:site-specific integrase n=1 Tax=Tabrizicola sp. TaxID=2005166 RepID=UPI0025F518C9|nr:site-specific integrase [Tabrizicola sp.]